MTENYYRPGEVVSLLGISDQGFRKWCKEFNDFLSPAAQRVTTESGTTAQRRFTDQDVAYFLRAQQLLKDGKTYDDTRATLTREGPPPIQEHQIPASSPEEPTTSSSSESFDEALNRTIALYNEAQVGLRALQEALHAKDETISTLQVTLSAKDETIHQLEARVADVVTNKDETIAVLKQSVSAQERHVEDLRLENERLRRDLADWESADVALTTDEASATEPAGFWSKVKNIFWPS
jgi:regulator of replication initiation timing